MTIISALPYTLTNGLTADANQVMADFNQIRNDVNTNGAQNGANSTITSLTGLTTPLSTAQGGTGSAVGPVLRGYLGGLTLSNNSNTLLNIAAGYATDSTNAVAINLGAIIKSTAGAWVVGSSANGMGQGLTIANNTWYHVFAIINAGVADAYFDTSAAGANAPAGTTAFRRIGSFRTNGSAQIVTFSQNGDEFLWAALASEVSSVTTSAVSAAKVLNVPLGVKVRAIFLGALSQGAGPVQTLFTAPDQGITSITAQASLSVTVASLTSSGQFDIRTSTAQAVNVVSSNANGAYSMSTMGWIDSRGRDD